MLLAHLPAGYILTKGIVSGLHLRPERSLMWLGVIGSILPDFDLAYFYLIDNRQHLHHSYWTHIPSYWVGILILGLAISGLMRSKRLAVSFLVLISTILLHLALDSFVGGIKWLHPFSGDNFRLITVPAQHGWWIWNFLFHWTFWVELIIIGLALVVFWSSRRMRADVSS